MTPPFPVQAPPVPVQFSTEGVLRVGGTRVTLDSIVFTFTRGATAEEIALRYPALTLADVYAAIAYYLRQQADVDDYLQQRRGRAESVQRDAEARFAPDGIRARLLARQSGQAT